MPPTAHSRQAEWIRPEIGWVDVNFLDIPNAIGTGVIRAGSTLALVDPGPSTSLAGLEAGLARLGTTLGDVSEILLTHVHLDHAGSTGTLVRRYPRIRVTVHERGMKHLVAPEKLINSATRYFGAEKMARYWGEILPVPADRVRTIGRDEVIDLGNRRLRAVYTPGHAVHHASYVDLAEDLVFAGDVAGIRINRGYVLPPTPPPDIEIDDWLSSLDLLGSLEARTLVVTHGGPVDDVNPHLEATRTNLQAMSDHVRSARGANPDPAQAVEEFGRHLRAEIGRLNASADLPAYEPTAPVGTCWFGLERYWATREPVRQPQDA
jgi:glyoxylase-like metal-dependent hydrolase (beta-lactamase superfamily II)